MKNIFRSLLIFRTVRFFGIFSIFFLGIAFATESVHQFKSEIEEEKYYALLEVLRCPKCQNQNIADSNATIAIDIRAKVYELVIEGKSHDEIVSFLVDRYGDFVSYIPPFRASTYVLWLGPPCLFLIGFFVFFLKIRLNKANKNQAVEVFDEKKLDQLINKVKD